MGGKNKMARIYLLEDINDNRYIGSTSELKLNCRLHTHRRDKKEMEMGKRKNGCSSALLDLHHCSITELKMVENIPELRTHWEKYYINNVYPECVNKLRYDCDKDEVQREYYEKNIGKNIIKLVGHIIKKTKTRLIKSEGKKVK